MLSFIDLFAGVGGFAEGFAAARIDGKQLFSPRLLVDNDPEAAASYRFNRPDVAYLVADLVKTSAEAILATVGMHRSELDVLVGGPPCQGFSSLRRNKVPDDPRNSLVRIFLDFAIKIKPKLILMENVPNFRSVAGGRFLREVLESLREDYLVRCEVLNAYDYGVPQWRRRTFIIAVNKELGIEKLELNVPRETRRTSPRSLMPDNDNGKLLPLIRPWVTVEDAIGDLPSLKAGEEANFYVRQPFTDYQTARRKSAVLLCNHAARSHDDRFLSKLSKIREGGRNAELDGRSRFDRGRQKRYLSQAYGRLHREGIAQTITAHFLNPGSGRFIHYKDLRSITVREAARFQSFDDDFVFTGSTATQQRLVGNAVPPLMARALAEHTGKLLVDAIGYS